MAEETPLSTAESSAAGETAKSRLLFVGSAQSAAVEKQKIEVKILPESIKKALEGVLKARQQGKGAVFAEIYATAVLRECAQAAAEPFLEICTAHLKEEGADSYSDSRVSVLLRAYDYLVEKKFKRLEDLPKDLAKFPTYHQIAAMHPFIKYPIRAEAQKPEWDALHNKVFSPLPAERPTVKAIVKAVVEILGPSRKKNGNKTEKSPTVTQTVVKPENLSEWYATIAPTGTMTVAEITVAKLNAQALATAMEANWSSVKDAALLRVKVGK